ncbi:hypothetical protein [Caldimonas tepidiphila]|uniref:hypothetical protein n=1 Tax=Caldimonas tepidiphila TaxID=2315841 RepID=UPI000E5B5A36|nr:hypothetical protein [Caldimonas tepidiphila]
MCRLVAVAALGLLAAGGALAEETCVPPAQGSACPQEAAAPAPAPAGEPTADCAAEAQDCVPLPDEAQAQGVAPPAIASTPIGMLPPVEGRLADGALLQANLAMPWGSGYLDAVLSAREGGRLVARGMGLQLRLPERRGDLLVGRYVSGGAGLRPDLPMVGLRYSSRGAALPQATFAPPPPPSGARGSRVVPAAPRALGHRIAVPAGPDGETLGTLEVKVRELRGKAPLAVAGSGLRLLPPGDSDVAMEAGTLARDAESFESIGIPAASLTVRHGWLAQQTLSARAVQAGDSLLLAGLSEFRLLGLATAGATVRERGQGAEPGWLLAHEYQEQGFTSRVRLEGVGEDVEPGGDALLGTPSRRNAELAVSWALSPARAITVTAGDRIKLDGGRAELLALSSSLRSSSGGQLSFGIKRARDGDDSTQLTLDWRIPLESGRPAAGRGNRPLFGGNGGVLR